MNDEKLFTKAELGVLVDLLNATARALEEEKMAIPTTVATVGLKVAMLYLLAPDE